MNRYERLLRRAYSQLRDVRADGGSDLEGDERGQVSVDPVLEMAAITAIIVVGWTAVTTPGWETVSILGVILVVIAFFAWAVPVRDGGEP